MNKRGKRYIGKAYGNSMYPLIEHGDKLFITQVSKTEISVGDIVVFMFQGKFISHRIVFKYATFSLTKGDNSSLIERPSVNRVIIGKVVKIVRGKSVIDLNSLQAKFVTLYLTLFSCASFFLPFMIRMIIVKIFIGRRYLCSTLLRNTK